MTTTDERRATLSDALRSREFRALTASYTLSLAGDDLVRVAMAIVFYQRTHSPLLAALTFVISYLPSIAGPLLSTLGDRLPRRNVMVVCDAARVVLIGLAALALTFDWPLLAPLGFLLIAAFFSPPFDSARAALVPQILTGDRYLAGSVATQILGQATQIVTYVISAGVVLAIGGEGALLIDATTFAVSAILLLVYVRRGEPDPGSAEDRGPGMVAMMIEGARDVFGDRVLRSLILLSTISAATAVIPEGLAIVYARDHNVDGIGKGLLVAAIPIGTVIGGVILSRVVRPARRIGLIRPLALASCLPLIATGLPLGAVVVFVLWAAVGALSGFHFVANAAFVRFTPDRVLSRAMGLAQTLLTVAQALGLLVGGAVAMAVSVPYVIAGAGVLSLAAMACVRWPVELSGRTGTTLSDAAVARPTEVRLDAPDEVVPEPVHR